MSVLIIKSVANAALKSQRWWTWSSVCPLRENKLIFTLIDYKKTGLDLKVNDMRYKGCVIWTQKTFIQQF